MIQRILLPMLCAFSLYGQRHTDIKPNILDQVQAQRVIVTTAKYNLKGPVQQVLEVNTTQKDTLLLALFNQNGQSMFVQNPKERISYVFKKDQLQTITSIRKGYPHDTVVSSFNAKGQLEKSVVSYMRQYEPEVTTLHYSYTGDFEGVTIKYSYSFDTSGWDVVNKDKYKISYDKEGRVRKIQNESVHKEFTYAYTRSYGYDAKGRITSVNLIDRDAGSNSAPSLHLTIFYNDEENSMTESLLDATIRNALWSYGYTKYERYNEHGDVIASEYSHQDDQFMLPDPFPNKKEELPEFKPTFEYDYDAHGNWVVKYMVDNDLRVEVSKREIVYFED